MFYPRFPYSSASESEHMVVDRAVLDKEQLFEWIFNVHSRQLYICTIVLHSFKCRSFIIPPQHSLICSLIYACMNVLKSAYVR